MGVERTYLDYNATAPLRDEARAAMIGAFDLLGNPSSVHGEGRGAHGVIETARADVAGYLGVGAREIVLTSGGTESNNWVIGGDWAGLVVSAVEHDSVLAPAAQVACPCHTVGVDARGIVDLGALETVLASLLERVCDLEGARGSKSVTERASGDGGEPRKVLVSIQAANSETGIVQPVGEIRAVVDCFAGALLHLDAVQLRACHRDLIGAARPDFVSLSAHKIGGPKGVGALFVREGLSLEPMIVGGGQELRRRSGTQNVAGIAGFGACARAAAGAEELSRAQAVLGLREAVERGVFEITPFVFVVGGDSDRLTNTSCICVPGVRAETLVMALDLEGVAVSAGSACSSGKVSVSHVLKAMGMTVEDAGSAVRVSLGWASTSDDVARFLSAWEVVMTRVLARRAHAGEGLKESA